MRKTIYNTKETLQIVNSLTFLKEYLTQEISLMEAVNNITIAFECENNSWFITTITDKLINHSDNLGGSNSVLWFIADLDSETLLEGFTDEEYDRLTSELKSFINSMFGYKFF